MFSRWEPISSRASSNPIWTGNVSIGWNGVDEEDPYPDPEQYGIIDWVGASRVDFGEDRKIEIP